MLNFKLNPAIKIASVFCVCFFTSTISSQKYEKYYELINLAELSYLTQNHVKSDSLFVKAFSLVDRPFKEDYLLAALNASKMNQEIKMFDYLEKGIQLGLTLQRIKHLKKEFGQVIKSNHFRKLKKEYPNTRQEYLNTIDTKLYAEIKEMLAKDQKARIPILGNWRKMKKVDTYNYNRLLEIIEENNGKWPGFSLIGETTPKGKYDVTANIALMLLHFKKEWIEQLEPYMLEAALNGEMYPYHYARILDYSRLSEKLCLTYGSYLNVPICDCQNADKIRKKIGFESINDYYQKRKSKYNCNTTEYK